MVGAIRFRKHLPSYRVGLEMLKEVEAYLVGEGGRILGFQDGEHHAVSVQDGMGFEATESVAKLPPQFYDTTESVRLERTGRQCELGITFHRSRDYSWAEIRAEGTGARERAQAFFAGLSDVLHRHRSWAWVVHPPFWVWPIVFLAYLTACAIATLHGLLGPALRLAIDATLHTPDLVRVRAHWEALAEALGQGRVVYVYSTLALGLYWTGTFLNPYMRFDSRRNQIKAKVWAWLSVGVIGTTAAVTILKRLVGI